MCGLFLLIQALVQDGWRGGESSCYLPCFARNPVLSLLQWDLHQVNKESWDSFDLKETKSTFQIWKLQLDKWISFRHGSSSLCLPWHVWSWQVLLERSFKIFNLLSGFTWVTLPLVSSSSQHSDFSSLVTWSVRPQPMHYLNRVIGWTNYSQVDIILIASQALGPADGSHYVINYFGAGLQLQSTDKADVVKSTNLTYFVPWKPHPVRVWDYRHRSQHKLQWKWSKWQMLCFSDAALGPDSASIGKVAAAQMWWKQSNSSKQIAVQAMRNM